MNGRMEKSCLWFVVQIFNMSTENILIVRIEMNQSWLFIAIYSMQYTMFLNYAMGIKYFKP